MKSSAANSRQGFSYSADLRMYCVQLLNNITIIFLLMYYDKSKSCYRLGSKRHK